MTRRWNVIRNVAACSVALLFLGVTVAQPPGRGKGRDRGDAPAKADPAVEAWVKVLAEKLTDKNDTISDSARRALLSIGSPAVPTLKKIADGDDKAAASAAKDVIAQIDRGSDRRGPGGNFGRGRPDEKGKGQPDEKGKGGPRPGGFGGFGGGNLLDRITKDLDLTDKQKDKVKDIVSAQEKKMREAFEKAREGGRPDFEKIRDTMKSMQTDLLKDLKDVLTADQLKKVEKALEGGLGGFPGGQRGPGGFPGFPGRGPGGPGRGPGTPGTPDTPRRPGTQPETRPGAGTKGYLVPALNDLDLTRREKEKAGAIAEKHDKKVRDLFDKATEAKQRPDYEAMIKLFSDAMKELKDVLPDDQYKKLEKALTPQARRGEF